MLLSPLFYMYRYTWELHMCPCSNEVMYGLTGGTLDWKVLWSRGTRGRGTLRMYPLGRFPTMPVPPSGVPVIAGFHSVAVSLASLVGEHTLFL